MTSAINNRAADPLNGSNLIKSVSTGASSQQSAAKTPGISAAADKSYHPSSGRLQDSLRLVLARKSHTAPGDIKLKLETRVNEQDMYAAIVHSKLSRLKAALGDKFAGQFGGLAARIKSDGKSDSQFKAADRIMRGMVRSGELTQTEYKTIRDLSFGKAQLDTDRRTLDKSTAGLAQALGLIVSNPTGSDDEIGAFKTAQARAGALKRAETPARSSKAQETGSKPDLKPSQFFLWKPVSDTTGKLVILLPATLLGQVAALKVISPAGGVLATGRYSGVNNGQREHYRFDQAGSAFPDGSRVQMIMKDGTVKEITIPQSEIRFEKKAGF